ncbi:unnamed protein product, partial [Vitis vinifera]|uniref:Uncharacterized protein n=1 Tax=Vitis vinifera TaxID=29760 RepID=D7T9C7_VITVI
MHPRAHLWEFTCREDDPIYCFITFIDAKNTRRIRDLPNSRSWKPSTADFTRSATWSGGMNWITWACTPTVSCLTNYTLNNMLCL